PECRLPPIRACARSFDGAQADAPAKRAIACRMIIRRKLSTALILLALLTAARAQAPEASPGALAEGVLPRDLSPWGMFVHADPLVKAVLIGLAFASFITWTVWLAKTIELVRAQRKTRAALGHIASKRRLADAADQVSATDEPVGQYLAAAVAELRLSGAGA